MMSYDLMWNFEISKLQNERYVPSPVDARTLLVILLVGTCMTYEADADVVDIGLIGRIRTPNDIPRALDDRRRKDYEGGKALKRSIMTTRKQA